MPATTPTLGLPYPTQDESVDVPRDVKALADKLDAGAIAPVGCIMMWPTVTPPQGWAICNGGTVPAASNPQLATLLGQTGGNVTLPNLSGRVPMGASGAHPLNETGGAETVALTAAQSGMPAHGHDSIPPMAGFIGDSQTFTGWEAQGVTGTGRAINTNFSTQTAGPLNAQSAHNNLQPYLAINYIIRVG